MGVSSVRHRKEPALATSGREGFRDSLNLRTERKGPQICSDQSVPWVPEQLWPPSAYLNRVSWKEQEAQANAVNEAGRGVKPPVRVKPMVVCPDTSNYQQKERKTCLAEQSERRAKASQDPKEYIVYLYWSHLS